MDMDLAVENSAFELNNSGSWVQTRTIQIQNLLRELLFIPIMTLQKHTSLME